MYVCMYCVDVSLRIYSLTHSLLAAVTN